MLSLIVQCLPENMCTKNIKNKQRHFLIISFRTKLYLILSLIENFKPERPPSRKHTAEITRHGDRSITFGTVRKRNNRKQYVFDDNSENESIENIKFSKTC